MAIGRDILYIGLSSALSGTYSSADVAARKLSKKFPENKIITIDSLSASAGIALLIDLLLKKKAEGATIEEAKDFVERTKLNICHLFTIDDTAFLVKSGRVKPSKAFLGNMLGIKPILKVDESGKLVATGRVRGRHQAILTLATKCKNYCNSELKYAYISHGDCPRDAEILKNTLEEYNIETNSYKELVKVDATSQVIVSCFEGECGREFLIVNNSIVTATTFTLTFDKEYDIEYIRNKRKNFRRGNQVTIQALPAGENVLLHLYKK